MEFKIFTVDAFTDVVFKGNPAGVCLLDHEKPAEVLQGIATEMNLSETAFLVPLTDKQWFGDMFSLRWFTPITEVDLCGHATLAAAHVLFYEAKNRNFRLVFETKSGTLLVEQTNDNYLIMNFPLDPSEPITIDQDLLSSLNIDHEDVQGYTLSKKQSYLTIELTNENKVINVKPNFSQLNLFTKIPLGGIIITSRSGAFKQYDFVSRFFAPWHGIDEDPVTGSAHTVLAPYWQIKLQKTRFKARQVSKRGGSLNVTLLSKAERVLIEGQSVTVIKGRISL